MRFQAISIGRHVPRGRFNGAVHSVFARAANIRLADERLVTLLPPGAGNAPHGVRLSVPEDFAFSDHLAPGQRVGCRADVLRIATTAVAFDLGAAAPWDGDAPCWKIDWRRPSAVAAWRVAWHALWCRRSATAPPRFLPRALENAPAHAVLLHALSLARATRMLCSERAARAVHRLIGRGPGLTPAGDDVVVGFLGALWSAIGSDPARGVFVRALGSTVERAAVATGDISRACLGHALVGSLAEPLAELRRQIGEGACAPAIESAMAKALRVGHTSGEDGALGLLLGLAAWAPDALFGSAVPRTREVGGMRARELGRRG
jgi:hypothetical protein